VISRTLQLGEPGIRKAVLGVLGAAVLVVLVGVAVKPREAGIPASSARALASPGPGLERLVTLELQSQPPGATVVDEQGKTHGVTPLKLLVPLGSQRAFDFVLPGYQTEHKEVLASLNTNVPAVLKPVVPPVVEKPRKRAPRRSATTPPPAQERDLDSKATTLNPFAR
jgi:hypothetical protein